MTRKRIRVGVLSPILELDPRNATDEISGFVLTQLYEPPFGLRSGTTETVPLLFSEPLRLETSTAQHPVYSAAVRPDVTFSDGSPLTAEVVARSLASSRVLDNKASVDWQSDRVYFTLNVPNARFDLTLTQGNCAIVRERDGRLLGTGAYVFEEPPRSREVQHARALRLVRNALHRRLANIEEVEFSVFSPEKDGEASSLAEAFRRGEVDLTSALHLSDLRRFQLSEAQVAFPPENSTGILFFSTARPQLSNAAARRALVNAIDLLAVAECCFDRDPIAFVAGSLLPPMMSRYTGFPRPNLDEARRLLATLSHARPKRLTLLVPWAPRPYLPKPLPVAQTIRRQLAEIDISVQLVETRSSEEFFQTLAAGQYDLALAGWIADTPDPSDFFEALLWSKNTEGEHHSNHSRWRNTRTDELLASYRANPSEAKLSEILRLVREEAPLLPLMYGQSIVVYSRKLRNVTLSADGVVLLGEADLRE